MAAPTRVQSTGRVRAAGATTVAMTFASPPTAGNTIVVGAILFAPSGLALSCTDNQGNTYAQSVVNNNGSVAVCLFACTSSLATGSPFTVTLSGGVAANYWEACAIEVTGAGGTGVLTVDRTVTATGSGGAPATGTTAALTGTDVLLVSCHAIVSNQTSITVQAVSPSWFEEVENLNYSATVAGEIDSRSLTGVLGTTQTCSWTDVSGGAYAAALAVFKGTAPAAHPRTQGFVLVP